MNCQACCKGVRRAAIGGLFALWLAPLPALAGNQSSNSSSNCSNGHCTRAETLVVEDQQGRRGWTRVEQWREGAGRHAEPPAPVGNAPRRDADDDDDDDD